MAIVWLQPTAAFIIPSITVTKKIEDFDKFFSFNLTFKFPNTFNPLKNPDIEHEITII